tara:strand:- start:57 stop:362 length:306 start_codon:yes stop_codon:yes gene_type:complete
MRIDNSGKGAGSRPFPQAGKTRAERQEDAFMELHGGRGAQLIYRIVCLIDAAAGWVILLVRGSSGASRVTEAEHNGPVMKDRGKKKPCRLVSATTPLKKHP